jgi:hypothetical protein
MQNASNVKKKGITNLREQLSNIPYLVLILEAFDYIHD